VKDQEGENQNYIQNQIDKNRLRWSGHIKRMNEHRIPNRVLEIKTNGKRPKGRPGIWWFDKAKRDTNRRWKILVKSKRNAGMDRQRQLEAPLEKSNCDSGKDIKKRKKKNVTADR
jgi:hypothetical protein